MAAVDAITCVATMDGNCEGGGHRNMCRWRPNNNREGVDGHASCLLAATVVSNTSASMARCSALSSFVQCYSTSGNLLLRDITQNRFLGKFCSKLMVCYALRISNLGTNMKSLGFMLQFDVWSEIKCMIWLTILRCDCDLWLPKLLMIWYVSCVQVRGR
jgi:hypothetical protein